MTMWILPGLTWALLLVVAASQIWTAARLRAARRELLEVMARQHLVLPVIVCDERGRITELYFDVGPVATEGELQLRIPIMRGVPKMTMGALDVAGDEVRLLVDFGGGVIVRATADDNLLPRLGPAVPDAFRRAFDG